MSLPAKGGGFNTPVPPGPSIALSIAIDYAKRGWPVLPICPPGPDGTCHCGGKWDAGRHQLVPHTGRDIGKAPIGRLVRAGVKDATTNTASIDRWLRTVPAANLAIALEPAGLVLVDPDSAETEASALSRGLDGGAVRDSRYRAYIFKRPAGCPAVNLIKADGDPLDIMATGYAVVHGTHATGCPVRFDPTAQLADAPAWVVELLKRKAAAMADVARSAEARRAARTGRYGTGQEPPVRLRERGQQRWNGELVAQKANGDTDRDLSLFYIGLDLAEAGASEPAIVPALAERDAALGWNKFTSRRDDREYVKIAEKAVARAIELERTTQSAGSGPSSSDLADLRARLEEAEIELARLRHARSQPDDAGPAPDGAGEPSSLEEARRVIATQREELRDVRQSLHDLDIWADRLAAIQSDQQVVISAQRERLEVLEPIVHGIDDILSRPSEELSAGDKVVLIGIARWLPSYRAKAEANGKPTTIALGYASKVVGLSKSTVSSTLDRFSSTDPSAGAPFRKHVTRRPSVDPDGRPIIDPKTGKQKFESELDVTPWHDRPAETLHAAAVYAQLHARPKHGGSRAAADARWGRCDQHNNAEVRVKGYCPDCGQVVGERTISVQEFEALNEQVAHSERAEATVSVSSSIGEQVGRSEPPRNGTLFDFEVAARPRPPTTNGHWRCPAPGCGALERTVRPDGSWRCQGRGHESAEFEDVGAAG